MNSARSIVKFWYRDMVEPFLASLLINRIILPDHRLCSCASQLDSGCRLLNSKENQQVRFLVSPMTTHTTYACREPPPDCYAEGFTSVMRQRFYWVIGCALNFSVFNWFCSEANLHSHNCVTSQMSWHFIRNPTSDILALTSGFCSHFCSGSKRFYIFWNQLKSNSWNTNMALRSLKQVCW